MRRAIVAALAVVLAGAVAASAATYYSTGFEPAEGYAPGFLPGQSGWTKLMLGSTIEPKISTVNPASGTQAVAFSYDPTPYVYLETAKSPLFGPQTAGRYIVSIDVSIDATGGANYSVIPQCVARAACRVDFDYGGNLWVRTNSGGAVDTGVAWTPGGYKTLTIDLDAGTDLIHYYYGGSLFYTTPVWTSGTIYGEWIDQVLLSSDNYNLNEVGRFDNLNVTPEPGSLALLAVVGLYALRRR